MFVGMGEKFQIWEPDSYQEDMELMEQKLSENNLEEEIYSHLDDKEKL
jgi:DNA-binding transcriptional regulator/RsmH inhibitor MraZ